MEQIFKHSFRLWFFQLIRAARLHTEPGEAVVSGERSTARGETRSGASHRFRATQVIQYLGNALNILGSVKS